MLRLYLFLLFFAFINLSIIAEAKSTLDSLKAVITSTKPALDGLATDTLLCNAHFLLGEQLYLGNPDTVLLLMINVQEIADQNLSAILSKKSDHSDPSVLEKRYREHLAESLNNIGYLFKERGDLHKALDYYTKCLDLDKASGDQEGLAFSLNNIGLIYDEQGDIAKALEYYHRSLKIAEENEDKIGIGNSLNNVALVYKQQGEVDKALDYYIKSLKLYREIDSKLDIAISLNNIGFLYKAEKDVPKALAHFKEALQLNTDIGNKKGIAYSLKNIGTLYQIEGDVSKALEEYQKSLVIYKEINNMRGIGYALYNIGGAQLKLGQLEASMKNGKLGLKLGEELGSPQLMSYHLEMLSIVAKKQGRYQESLEMYELYIQMSDSIKNEQTQKATIRQQTKYEFEKAQLVKEQEEKEEARVLAEETSRRDNLQYSIVLIGLLVIGVLVAMLGRLSLPERVAEGLIFFAFLILFEFILVLADPYVDEWTGGAPGLKLLINAGVAALIFPLHSFFEIKLKKRVSR